MKKVRVISCLMCFLFTVGLLTPGALAASPVLFSVIVSCAQCGRNYEVIVPCGGGSTTSRCNFCSNINYFFDLHPHDWRETGRIEPTAESEGSIAYKCLSCGLTKSVSIPKLEPVECPHDWIETGRTEPTFTSEGSITYECSICGTTKNESIPKLEECTHTWVETGRTEPTTTKPGFIEYTCSQCGDTKTESIPMLPIKPDPDSISLINWLGSVTGLFNMTVNSIMSFPALRFFAGVAVFLTMFGLLGQLLKQGRKGRL